MSSELVVALVGGLTGTFYEEYRRLLIEIGAREKLKR
jgi:hypothetical protein